MYRILHIVTTGTSIIRNSFNLCTKLMGLRDYCDLLRAWASASVDSSEDLEAGRNAIPASPVFKALLEALASDPRRISAELNAFFNYLDTLRGLHEHYITLLSSDTGVGWLCTRVLEEFLKTMDKIPGVYVKNEHYIKNIEAIRVQLLGRDFIKGSLNLITEAKKATRKYRGLVDEVVFNPTGGYKPETGFLLLVAGLIGASRVYYIHETMHEVAEIPVIPVTIAEPVKTVFEKALRGELTPLDYQVLREQRILRPGEKEPTWLQQLAKIVLG